MQPAGWCALGLLLTCAAPAAGAQVEGLFGRTVVSITMDIEGIRTTEPALADLVQTRVGDPLDPRDVRDSIAHLFGLGRFEDVRVHADAVEGGVAVRYELLPTHAVGRIEFRGNTGLDAGRLRRIVTERFGLSPSAARTGDVVRVLEGVYRDYGYMQPRIRPDTAVEHRRERTTLIFDIDAGPRLTIARVSIEGNAPGPLAQARAALGVSTGQPYDRTRIASRLADYVAGLRRRGYYEAHAEHTLVVAPDQRTGELVIELDAGPHITVVFEGEPLPPRVRAELVPVEREGSVDEDLLEDSARRITELLRSQGYRDAEVTYGRTPRNGELAIVFRVARGAAYRTGRVQVEGNSSLPLADLAPLLRVREGEPFVESLLDADVNAIRDAYRRRGFADVAVHAAVVPESGPDGVTAIVRVTITEGARTVIAAVTVEGNGAIADERLQEGIGSRPGEPLYQPQLALDRDTMLLHYLNRGFKDARIDVRVDLADDSTRGDVRFVVDEGVQIVVDHILIVGNEKTNPETVRRELTLRPGDPLGFDAVAESQRRISALGLFRRVRITEIDHGAGPRRDLLVTVEEAPSTTIGYGGGGELNRRLVRTSAGAAPSERLEIAPRGFFEIGRRNLFGRNRSVNLFTRLSLRVRNDPVLTDDGQQPPTDFNEYRLLATYRQPRLLANADFLATGFVEQGARTSFDFNRRGARAELGRRIRRTLSLSARYALDRTEVFNATYTQEDALHIDRLFPQIRLSTVSSSLIRDTRDDPLGPTRGALLGFDAEVSGRAMGSEVGFIKSFAQGFVYRGLPGRQGMVLATGARLGLAAGFARAVPGVGEEGEPTVEVIDDLPASERFFAGGDTTVRGFGLDQLGTTATLDPNGFPRGGNAVLVMNAELRVPVWKDLGAVAFVDGGNVFARVGDFALGDLRGAAGFGLRYRSPVGPLRLDFGFKLDRQLLPTGQQERPTALHISLGQAF